MFIKMFIKVNCKTLGRRHTDAPALFGTIPHAEKHRKNSCQQGVVFGPELKHVNSVHGRAVKPSGGGVSRWPGKDSFSGVHSI